MREQHTYSFIVKTTIGFCLSVFATAVTAANTITIDVTNPNASVDYNEVNKFNEAQDTKNMKHVAMDGSTLIISDKPITLPDKNKSLYKPRTLSDLGYRVLASDSQATIAKAAPYMLANRNLIKTPSVPYFEVTPQVTSVSVSAPAAVQIAAAAQPGVSTSSKPFMSAASTPAIAIKATTPVQLQATGQSSSMMISLVLAGLALLAMLGLTRLRSRKSSNDIKQTTYTGQLTDATEMIGKGDVFDFNRHLNNGQVIPMNTTYLNMLWKVGKFSNEGAVDTYFYMAYYIPSLHAYAATLQNKKAETRQKTDA